MTDTPTAQPNERDREVAEEVWQNIQVGIADYHQGVGPELIAHALAAARADERAKRDALLIDAMNLLEANVRTKSRDDLAEQKLIVAIRSMLWGD